MPLATDTNPLRSRKQESLRLETKSSDSRSLFEKAVVNLTRINKKVQGHLGKIIKVGSAIFKSNFESGSLGNVEQIGINAYRVSMDKEINSTRPSAWFYFSC